MSSALSRVMDQADEAASNLPAVQNPQGQQLAPTNIAPRRPSLDAMADSSGIQVDEFLTIKDTGFRLGDAKAKMFNEFTATIDMSEVVAITAIRATRNGNTTFIKSYDGISTSQGQSFQQAEANLRSTHEKVDGPYDTAEIPLTLDADVGGLKAGDRIGITPSITGAKFFTKFYNELRREGKQADVVKVKVVHTPQSNKNGNEWGVAAFELIG